MHAYRYVQSQADGVQCIGGTGALSLAAQFLGKFHPCKTVMMPQPTWRASVFAGPKCARCTHCACVANHRIIFSKVGLMQLQDYRYYDERTKQLDFDGMCADLKVCLVMLEARS